MATAALAAAGYQAARGGTHHFRTIRSLELTIGLDLDLVDTLDAFRKRRNVADYERAGTVSETEADEALALAQRLRRDVGAWIAQYHPTLQP